MIFTVPILVYMYYEDGDALSVFFNTIVILFLCDVDNAAYAMGLGDRVRSHEWSMLGAWSLVGWRRRASALVWTKVAHIGATTTYGLGMVWLHNRMLGVALARDVPFWIGGVVEALVVTSGGTDTTKRVCKMTGAALLGPVVLLMLLGNAALANRWGRAAGGLLCHYGAAVRAVIKLICPKYVVLKDDPNIPVFLGWCEPAFRLRGRRWQRRLVRGGHNLSAKVTNILSPYPKPYTEAVMQTCLD
jgi:hypothetical protein